MLIGHAGGGVSSCPSFIYNVVLFFHVTTVYAHTSAVNNMSALVIRLSYTSSSSGKNTGTITHTQNTICLWW